MQESPSEFHLSTWSFIPGHLAFSIDHLQKGLMAKNEGYVPHKTLLHSSGGAEEQPQCRGERGNQTEKLGPCEDQGPSKQEEDCIHQSPCTNHAHRVISILAHSSPNPHMHHSPNTHLFQSSSPTTPRFFFFFWFESSSSLMVTFLG